MGKGEATDKEWWSVWLHNIEIGVRQHGERQRLSMTWKTRQRKRGNKTRRPVRKPNSCHSWDMPLLGPPGLFWYTEARQVPMSLTRVTRTDRRCAAGGETGSICLCLTASGLGRQLWTCFDCEDAVFWLNFQIHIDTSVLTGLLFVPALIPQTEWPWYGCMGAESPAVFIQRVLFCRDNTSKLYLGSVMCFSATTVVGMHCDKYKLDKIAHISLLILNVNAAVCCFILLLQGQRGSAGDWGSNQ